MNPKFLDDEMQLDKHVRPKSDRSCKEWSDFGLHSLHLCWHLALLFGRIIMVEL